MITAQPDFPIKMLGIISSCGGGDWPPLLSLAMAMHQRGHDVLLICDLETREAVETTGIPMLYLPSNLQLSNFFNPVVQRLLSSGEAITTETINPLRIWAENCLPAIVKELKNWQPTLILGSLLCLELSEMLANTIGVPWCFINPSFHFGDHSSGPVTSDFSVLGAQMYLHWLLPPMQKATIILHATDPKFDIKPTLLPKNHYYTGPLFWEFPIQQPEFLQKPGPPWILISLSTAPQSGDMEIVQTALSALKDIPVRVLVTLSPQHEQGTLQGLAKNVFVTGYIPHSMVLPLSRLAISHAGHGMVMKAIYHGTPMVLIPWGRDQPGVAARAEALGVANVIHRNTFTTATLAGATKTSLADPNLALRAKSHSHRLQKMNSLSCACSYLESLSADLAVSGFPQKTRKIC